MTFIDRNSAIHIASIALGASIAAWRGSLIYLVAVPGALIALNELLYFSAGVSIFAPAARVRRAYEWFDIYLDEAFGHGRDLTEAYFAGDPDKPFEVALSDKFDRIIKFLGLRPGDRLLDVGCGYGDFLRYAEERGIQAQGITLSAYQAAVCQSRGLDVMCGDARHPPALFDEKFDAVTFMGCLEHFTSARLRHRRDLQDQAYRDVFETAHRLLKPDSPIRRVFSSTLHDTAPTWSLRDYLHAYLVERHYSGLYPQGDEGLVRHSERYFERLHQYDATEDYRLASERDPTHFGSFKIRWTLRRVLYVPLLALLDPFALHKWAYHVFGSWMWQFGGVGGLPKETRPVTLWWFVLRAKPVGEVG